MPTERRAEIEATLAEMAARPNPPQTGPGYYADVALSQRLIAEHGTL